MVTVEVKLLEVNVTLPTRLVVAVFSSTVIATPLFPVPEKAEVVIHVSLFETVQSRFVISMTLSEPPVALKARLSLFISKYGFG